MTTRKQPPNILFIMADQMKWSALRIYSEIGIAAPSIERLASQGVTYRHAITPHPLCVPARTSVMTGRYPHSTGCRRNETLMPDHETHAFQIWKDAGYTTALIGKNHCYELQQDLDLFDVRCEISHAGIPEQQAPGMNPNIHGMEWTVPEKEIHAAHKTRRELRQNPQSPTIAYARTEYPIEHYGTSLVTAQTEALLESIAADTPSNPFAIWVSYPDPHEPYEAPARYADMFPPEHVPIPPVRQHEFDETPSISQDAPYPPAAKVSPAPEVNRVLHRMMGIDKDKEEHIRGVIATYHAMCRFIDDGIGRIIDKIEELGIRDNTIIVFTSDHGDFMGEHNMIVKGGVFYDCLTRVPLIVSYPDSHTPQGVTDDSMVNTIDILPTLLQLQGLADFKDIDDGWASKHPADTDSLDHPASTLDRNGKLQKSLARRIQGHPLPTITDASPREVAFSEYGTGGPPITMSHIDQLPRPLGYRSLIQTLWAREAQGRRKMARTKHWKYVTDPLARDDSPPTSPVSAGRNDTTRSVSGADSQDELYDLQNDPWELYNIAHDPRNTHIISEMRRLINDWMIQTEDSEPVPLPQTITRPSE